MKAGMTNQTGEPVANKAPEPAASSSGTFFFRDLGLSILIAVAIVLFLYQPVKVEGTSMMPVLRDQERIFINKFIYRFGIDDIRRGDLVVFLYPGDVSKSYIKRVIGIPGDEVEVREGAVLVNGSLMNEPYVPEEFRDRISSPRIRVKPGEYYVLGDHRSASNDSRSWGTVPKAFVYGKAVFKYWPLDKLGRLD
ncbi:MAG: signal peptidase I [Acidobacteriota bacterium]